MIGLDKLMQHGIGLGGGSNIKSIQHGFVADLIGSGTDITYDVPISEVDVSKAIVLVSVAGINQYQESQNVSGVITSSTNLRLRFQARTRNISYTVIEFENVKSLQKGTANIGSNPSIVTPTISSIDPAKSILIFSTRFTSGSGTTWVGVFGIAGRIKSSNTVEFVFAPTSGWNSIVAAIEYQVVEF